MPSLNERVRPVKSMSRTSFSRTPTMRPSPNTRCRIRSLDRPSRRALPSPPRSTPLVAFSARHSIRICRPLRIAIQQAVHFGRRIGKLGLRIASGRPSGHGAPERDGGQEVHYEDKPADRRARDSRASRLAAHPCRIEALVRRDAVDQLLLGAGEGRVSQVAFLFRGCRIPAPEASF